MSRTSWKERSRDGEGKIALIDGDVVLYAAGFSSDSAAKKEGMECEPMSHCIFRAKKLIAAVTEEAGCTSHRLVISSPVNSREAMFPEYKANRDRTKRPYWYKELKAWILKKHSTILADEGCEADDALGYLHKEIPDSVICTIDKDLQTVPGTHFNWSPKNRERGVFHVEQAVADRNLYMQILTGDATDNIPGIYKHNGTKVTKAVAAGLEGCGGVVEMYDYCLDKYKGDKEAMHLVANLVYIQRERGQQWHAPK